MTILSPRRRSEYVFGTVGLFFLLLIARLAAVAVDDRGYRRAGTLPLLARRGVDAIALLGWIVDRLMSAPSRQRIAVNRCRLT